MEEQNKPGPLRLDICRFTYAPDHTAGVLRVNGFECYTLELPWLDNRPGKSCIPEGIYEARFGMHYGGNKGEPYRCVELLGVIGRTEIEIHHGNVPSDILGCVIVGRRLGGLAMQRAVLESRAAFNRLMALLLEETVRPGMRVIVRSNLGLYAPTPEAPE